MIMKARDIMKEELRKEIERIVEKINAELPNRLSAPFDIEIVEVGTHEPMGGYSIATATQSALISVNLNARDTWGAARHELGHHVWESYLTAKRREEWTEELWKDGTHISDYGQTNAAEGFAEAFMLYFQGGEWLPATIKQFIEE